MHNLQANGRSYSPSPWLRYCFSTCATIVSYNNAGDHAVADPENFGGGNLKPKPQKFGCLHQNWDWFFGRNRKFKRFFRPKSGGLHKKKKKDLHQNWDWFFGRDRKFKRFFSPKFRWSPKKKKKKKVLTKIETDFSAGFVTFRSVGGMHPEMEPNYSK